MYKRQFLQTLNFDAMDALIAVTGSDEINAMLALYGRSRQIGLVFCRQNTHSYLPILHEAKIRTGMPKDLATEQILGYVRSIDVYKRQTLPNCGSVLKNCMWRVSAAFSSSGLSPYNFSRGFDIV